MHLVHINQPWWFSMFEIPTGQYILGDVPLAQALTQHAVESIDAVTPATGIVDGDNIFLVRPGSYGDLLLLTPVVRELEKIYPNSKVTVVCHPKYAVILDKVCETVPYPVTAEDYFNERNRYIFLEGVLEFPTKEEKIHNYVSRFAHACGIKKISDRRISYFLSPDEAAWAEDQHPKEEGKVRLGIQVRASAENRSYQPHKIVAVIANLLGKMGGNKVVDEVFLFGAPGDIRDEWGDVPEITNLSADGDHSVRMSVAVAKTCDILLVPDSLFMHIAGALDIPAIVIAGSFDPSITQGQQRSVQSMRGMGNCRFCSHLPVAGNPFPPGEKCSVERVCSVINSFSPDVVAHNLTRVLRGKTL